jgi:hypothetical protein
MISNNIRNVKAAIACLESVLPKLFLPVVCEKLTKQRYQLKQGL